MSRKLSSFWFAAALFAFAPTATAGESGKVVVSLKVTDIEGNTRSCTGETVYAVPVRSRTRKVILQHYGNDQAGYDSIYGTPELILQREGTQYVGMGVQNVSHLFRQKISGLKRGSCDDASVATIGGLKAGDYYLILPVFWKRTDIPGRPKDISFRSSQMATYTIKLPTNYRGGTYMVRVDIKGSETVVFDLVNEIPADAPESE